MTVVIELAPGDPGTPPHDIRAGLRPRARKASSCTRFVAVMVGVPGRPMLELVG
jgi:hypothetical protein